MKVNIIIEKTFPGLELNLIRRHRIFDLDHSVSGESGDEGKSIA